jgi:ribosome-binding factor A
VEYRLERLGTLIQEIIGKLIVEGKIKDPRVNSFLSITRVGVSKDLTWVDIYVSTFRSSANLDRGIAGLQSAAGFIQARLAREMRIRQTPKLRFHPDTNFKDALDLIKKIDEITGENAPAALAAEDGAFGADET